jgi:SAM-dependent methyltransferase
MIPDSMYDNYYSGFMLRVRHAPADYDREVKRLQRLLKDLLPDDKDSRVLEIGCGVGFFLNYLKTEGYRHIAGVDIAPEAIEACRRNVTDNVERCDAIEYLHRAIERNQSFDVIVMLDTLEHFEKSEAAEVFRLCHTLLAPEGRLLVKVGNMTNVTSLHLAYADFTHRIGFTEESLEFLYRVTGFSMCRFVDPPPVRLVSRLRIHLERWLHSILFWLARAKCPQHVGRKLIAVGFKGTNAREHTPIV